MGSDQGTLWPVVTGAVLMNAAAFGEDNGTDEVARAVHLVIDHDIIIVGHLLSSERASSRRVVICSSVSVDRRRSRRSSSSTEGGIKDKNRIPHLRSHGEAALHIDLQKNIMTLRALLVHPGARGTVQIAVDAGVFQKRLRFDHLPELRHGNEEIITPRHFAGPGCARGRGNAAQHVRQGRAAAPEPCPCRPRTGRKRRTTGPGAGLPAIQASASTSCSSERTATASSAPPT